MYCRKKIQKMLVKQPYADCSPDRIGFDHIASKIKR